MVSDLHQVKQALTMMARSGVVVRGQSPELLPVLVLTSRFAHGMAGLQHLKEIRTLDDHRQRDQQQNAHQCSSPPDITLVESVFHHVYSPSGRFEW
jgi:hypothetical protein